MDEEKDFVHSESMAYPMSALIADVGGAAGLFLGLSVIVLSSKFKNIYPTSGPDVHLSIII